MVVPFGDSLVAGGGVVVWSSRRHCCPSFWLAVSGRAGYGIGDVDSLERLGCYSSRTTVGKGRCDRWEVGFIVDCRSSNDHLSFASTVSIRYTDDILRMQKRTTQRKQPDVDYGHRIDKECNNSHIGDKAEGGKEDRTEGKKNRNGRSYSKQSVCICTSEEFRYPRSSRLLARAHVLDS